MRDRAQINQAIEEIQDRFDRQVRALLDGYREGRWKEHRVVAAEYAAILSELRAQAGRLQ